MADPNRSEAAQKGAWKRTINERRIEGLEKKLARFEGALRRIEKHTAGYDSMSSMGIAHEIASEALKRPEG